MEFLKEVLHYFLHLDDQLKLWVAEYPIWIYGILFLIIFVETGLVIMPFLPGDSLLFVAGSLATLGGPKGGEPSLNIFLVIILLFIAAFLGDTVNYLIGKKIGPAVFKRDYKLLKRAHLLKTQEFFEKHGPKTIIIARFIPIIRTFAPFIAGVGTMNYGRFISYNIIGGAVWVVGLTLLGYFFGSLEIVKKNFELVIMGIIVLSLLPPVIEFLRSKFSNKTA